MPMHTVFVDESEPLLRMIEILLQQRVHDGEITLRTYSKRMDLVKAIESYTLDPGLIFWDMEMPIGLLHELQETKQCEDVPVVALSANRMEEVSSGVLIKYSDWIVKLDQPEKLRASLNRVIDKHLSQKIFQESKYSVARF